MARDSNRTKPITLGGAPVLPLKLAIHLCEIPEPVPEADWEKIAGALGLDAKHATYMESKAMGTSARGLARELDLTLAMVEAVRAKLRRAIRAAKLTRREDFEAPAQCSSRLVFRDGRRTWTLARLGPEFQKIGSEQESGRTRAGVSFTEKGVSVDWRVETKRLDQNPRLAGLHRVPARN
jgi:hypothetical protein